VKRLGVFLWGRRVAKRPGFPATLEKRVSIKKTHFKNQKCLVRHCPRFGKEERVTTYWTARCQQMFPIRGGDVSCEESICETSAVDKAPHDWRELAQEGPGDCLNGGHRQREEYLLLAGRPEPRSAKESWKHYILSISWNNCRAHCLRR